jgi:hypothetical protein
MFVRNKACGALSLAFLLVAGLVLAQESPPGEYRVKAAFLWNFAKFIEWPTNAFTNAAAPFVIGVLGDNPFGEDLEQTVRDKQINTHPITVKAFRAASEANQCHMLFVSASETNRLAEIFKSLRGSPILTVGDTGQFIETGGMINFIFEGNKIRFQINDDAAKAADLKISSKLLSLAVRNPAK